MASGPIASWSKEDKVKETIERSFKYLAPGVISQLKALLTPENLAILVATLVIWGASHFVGVGEVVDVILLLVGALMLGPSIVTVVEKLMEFGKCILATTDEELDRSAKAFADAVVLGGITVVMAILLRKGAKSAELRVGTPKPSWLEVAKPKGPRGLPDVGPDPYAGQWWSRVKTTGEMSRQAGTGQLANWFGDIFYSLRGTATDQQLVLIHENFHRFLTPRFALFRTLRVQIRAAGYSKSVLLKAIEEAMCETVAQLAVNGFKGLIVGIRFPVANGYLTVSTLASEGGAIGTIVVGVQRFTVLLVGPPNTWPPAVLPPSGLNKPLPGESPKGADAPSIEQVPLMGVHIVGQVIKGKVAKGDWPSSIAQKWYGDMLLWPILFDHNRGPDYQDPNKVYVGQRIEIPKINLTQEERVYYRKRGLHWR